MFIEILALVQIITGFFIIKCRSWACTLAIGLISLNTLFFIALFLSENSKLGVIMTLCVAFVVIYYPKFCS